MFLTETQYLVTRMGYVMPPFVYRKRMRLPNGGYRGITQTLEGWVVEDLATGTVFGCYSSLEQGLMVGHAYGLNLFHSAPETLQSATESTPSTLSMTPPILGPEGVSSEHSGCGFEDYCKHFENPKNVSSFKFIVDQTGSTGWVILKEGRSEYGRYSSVKEALVEAYRVGLNL